MELSPAEVVLVIEALEEAAFFRDARSRVVRSAVRRSERRRGESPRPDDDDDHRAKARAFQELAVELKRRG